MSSADQRAVGEYKHKAVQFSSCKVQVNVFFESCCVVHRISNDLVMFSGVTDPWAPDY